MKYLIAIFTLCIVLSAAQQASKGSNLTKPTEGASAPVKEQKWYKTEISLHVYHDKSPGRETANAQGFWQPISKGSEKQLVDVIAVKIECIREERVCREADASMGPFGILEVQVSAYDITSWTESSIVADDADQCNRHTLAIDFMSDSVTVTDYPLKRAGSDDAVLCKPLPDSASYALHGGQWQLFPPPPWNPREWNNDK